MILGKRKRELMPLMARLPIFDVNKQIYAYSLLYRRQIEMLSSEDSEAVLRANLINQMFANLNIEGLVGSYPLAIPFDAQQIQLAIPSLLPQESIIIELLPPETMQTQWLDAVKDYYKLGYKIALDITRDNIDYSEVLPFVDIIKVNFRDKKPEQIDHILSSISNLNALLMAYPIETSLQFELSCQKGFRLFQGFYLSKPEPDNSKKVSVLKSNTLHLLTTLSSPTATINELEKVFMRDPKLCFRILLIVNSAFYRGVQKIESIKDAIVRVGMDKIKNWAMLLLTQNSIEQPMDLIERTLIRARMCELVARKIKVYNTASYYTVGILSTIDSLLNVSMSALMQQLSVSNDIKSALLTHEGDMGKVLHSVMAYEQGRFDELIVQDMDNASYYEAYLASIEYAKEIMAMWRLFKL